jgi:hypothetical protein
VAVGDPAAGAGVATPVDLTGPDYKMTDATEEVQATPWSSHTQQSKTAF